MSYPNPDTTELTLKGIDLLVQSMQLQVKTFIPWVNESFGLTDRIVEQREGKPFVYPAMFQDSSDPISLMPSDEWGNFCFWTKDAESKFETSKTVPGRMVLNTYIVHLIFYCDIKRMTEIGYKTAKSLMVNDIFNFFNRVRVSGVLTPLRFTEDDITKVYDGFTLDQLDNKWSMYPKWAARMTCELSFWEPCYVTNSL